MASRERADLALPGDTDEEDRHVEDLADALSALANANRLRLLRWLTVPTAAGDIPLSPEEVRPGENPDRVMTRQGVRAHLKKLAEHGLLDVRRDERPTGPVDAFVLNHQRVFALLEELRALTIVRPEVRVDAMRTLDAPRAMKSKATVGPRVVVVKGREEGRVVPLVRSGDRDGRGWTIGRRPECDVALDYDPFVSGEHAEIVPLGAGAFEVMDLRASKNGTFVNFQRLDRGARRKLSHGDIVGVGASLLVFHTE